MLYRISLRVLGNWVEDKSSRLMQIYTDPAYQYYQFQGIAYTCLTHVGLVCHALDKERPVV